MAKGYNIIPKILEEQKGKLFKNSQCSICDCYLCIVKLKKHPLTKENVILCEKCFRKLLKEKDE